MTTGKTATKISRRPAGKAAAKGKTGASAKPAAKAAVKARSVPAGDAKKARKTPKLKVVRDSFTMPQNEYQKIAEIKAACLKAKMQVKKSEVLRAGLKVLAELEPARLKKILNGLEKIKTGRPNKH
jgi:hypothetical protein